MKEGLILKYLEGTSTEQQVSKVEAWLAENAAHSNEMSQMQRVWKEIDGLSEYQEVSVNEEWNSIAALLDTKDPVNPSSKQSSSTVDESLPSVKKVETKDSDSLTNLQKTTSDGSSKYQSTKQLESSSTAPSNATPINKNIGTKTEKTGLPENLIYFIAALLFFAVLAFGLYKLIAKKDVSLETASAETEKYITLPDQSEVVLAPFSRISYPREMTGEQRRVSLLAGNAEFDVVADTEPFIVEYDDVSVMALGTAFDFSRDEEYATVECIDGDIRFFETEDPDVGMDMTKGQIVRYANGLFEDISSLDEELEEPSAVYTSSQGTEITLAQLLDWLMENSDWKVTSSPSMPIDGSHVIAVDLESGYESVIKQLDDLIDIEYAQKGCSNCYVLKKMKAL